MTLFDDRLFSDLGLHGFFLSPWHHHDTYDEVGHLPSEESKSHSKVPTQSEASLAAAAATKDGWNRKSHDHSWSRGHYVSNPIPGFILANPLWSCSVLHGIFPNFILWCDLATFIFAMTWDFGTSGLHIMVWPCHIFFAMTWDFGTSGFFLHQNITMTHMMK